MPREPELSKISRIVDLRIPLPWLIGLVASGLSCLIGMWFNIQQLTSEVQSLKEGTKANNGALHEVIRNQDLQKFRTDRLEDDVARLKGLK